MNEVYFEANQHEMKEKLGVYLGLLGIARERDERGRQNAIVKGEVQNKIEKQSDIVKGEVKFKAPTPLIATVPSHLSFAVFFTFIHFSLPYYFFSHLFFCLIFGNYVKYTK